MRESARGAVKPCECLRGAAIAEAGTPLGAAGSSCVGKPLSQKKILSPVGFVTVT